ncbi:heavy metal translocating P-type ATPase [Flavobacterium sp. '19STA2R22 D10 B1']|uniref:heavy metal translocating P-type ATPase n=1 Tax=Flavobacterium aerium TaxID=3037261 RepID=UPI00278C8DB8|nr:heavy metal translocating P-type ATPase [Flavobacterium sp. '19STA2R22 D10 B1']
MSEHCQSGQCGEGSQQTFFKNYKEWFPVTLSFIIFIIGIILDRNKVAFFTGNIRLILFGISFLLVGGPVIMQAIKSIGKGQVFTEFFLMSIATIGAFIIGEYPEGVAVMLFYTVGELVQEAAVNRSKRNIQALLDVRPDTVNVIRNNTIENVKAESVSVGEVIQAKVGEKIALDGILLSSSGSFNTAALTGESQPDTKRQGETVLAGMINLQSVVDIKVTSAYTDSKLSKILQMVQDATSRKSKTQQFITKFAAIYTPIVVVLAILLCVVPYFVVSDYVFRDWLYRALVFLVVSCPCALVISIPLGYFGGIGAASKNGILFKGATFLDTMATIQAVVMDKTGTLTKGVFKVQKVVAVDVPEQELIQYTAALETKSTHPVGTAIIQHANGTEKNSTVIDVKEIAGHGLMGTVDGKTIVAGNLKLMKKLAIQFDPEIEKIPFTIIVVAINNKYAGYFLIADEIKEDAKQTIESLHRIGVKTVMLSGDKQAVVTAVAKELNIDEAYGDLLPENKVEKVEALKAQGLRLAFVGDGVNDAPVIALADAGIAMGGLGSDATIETADIVIQNDQPLKIFTSINIGQKTKKIVVQNITLAFVVKAIVLVLGAGGLASMWEAVFADVGVALIAILNAVRIQRMKF